MGILLLQDASRMATLKAVFLTQIFLIEEVPACTG